MSAAPAASEANVGLFEPHILENRETYSKKLIEKGEFFIIKYDKNNEDSRKMNLILQENITLPSDEKAVEKSKDPKKLPWDVVVIMTTKWLLVARPLPQKIKKNAKDQAKYIWKEAEKLLEDDKDLREIDTIICWFLVPNDEKVFTHKLHTDVHPIQVEERVDRYIQTFRRGAKKIGRLNNLIIQDECYVLGQSPGPGDQTISHRSQIVVHDLGTFLGVAEYSELKITMDYDLYLKSEHNRLRFPPISLMAQYSRRNLDNYEVVVTDMEYSRVVWYDEKRASDSYGSNE